MIGAAGVIGAAIGAIFGNAILGAIIVAALAVIIMVGFGVIFFKTIKLG